MTNKEFGDEMDWLAGRYESISGPTAARLVRKFGGIEGISKTTRHEVKRVRGVDETAIQSMDIWDEEGNPIKEIQINICPVCEKLYRKCETITQNDGIQLQKEDACLRLRPSGSIHESLAQARTEVYFHSHSR